LDQEEDEAIITAMMDAQRSLLAMPVLGLPCVSVPTGAVGNVPVGVQIVAGRFREDLCLGAAEIIEAHTPKLTPIDPR
jgi:amidase